MELLSESVGQMQLGRCNNDSILRVSDYGGLTAALLVQAGLGRHVPVYWSKENRVSFYRGRDPDYIRSSQQLVTVTHAGGRDRDDS